MLANIVTQCWMLCHASGTISPAGQAQVLHSLRHSGPCALPSARHV